MSEHGKAMRMPGNAPAVHVKVEEAVPAIKVEAVVKREVPVSAAAFTETAGKLTGASILAEVNVGAPSTETC